MLLFKWMQIFFSPEGETPGGGGGGAAETPPPGGGVAGESAPVSLRAQLASQLGDNERDSFSKWAEQYPTDKDFVLGAVNMRSQFDQRVPVPKDDSKPEEVSKYFERVGKPATPKDYAYDFGKDEAGKPRELPDGDRARLEAFKEHAHANHYTQKQFDAGLKFLEQDIAKQETEFAETLNRAQDNSVSHLKQKWGPDFDANLAAAIDGGVAYAPDEKSWVDFVNLPLADGIKVGDHPTFLETMAKIGRSSAEDQRVRNMRQSGEADDIAAQIKTIESEAMSKGKLPSDREYHERLEPLYKKLHPKTMTNNGGGFGA